MKHCPNPDCRGLAKFGFVSEYNESATECGDCQAALVPGPAPLPVDPEPLCEPEPEPEIDPADRPDPDPDLKLVPLMAARDQAQLILIKEALDLAGIQFMIKGEGIQALWGFGQITLVNPVTGPVEIHVAEDDADDARKAVTEILG